MARSTGKTQVNVLLPDRVATQIRVIAEVDGRPVSHLVEEAIRDYIDRRKTDDDWKQRHDEWASKQRALLKAL